MLNDRQKNETIHCSSLCHLQFRWMFFFMSWAFNNFHEAEQLTENLFFSWIFHLLWADT